MSALPSPACGCDYHCIALDEYRVNVRCICPEGWQLKKHNSTACEREYFLLQFEIDIDCLENIILFVILHLHIAKQPGMYEMRNVIVFFSIVTLLLVSALGMLIFILCKFHLIKFMYFIRTRQGLVLLQM